MDIVKNNEPHLALFADDNGLRLYEEILMKAKYNLKKDFLKSQILSLIGKGILQVIN